MDCYISCRSEQCSSAHCLFSMVQLAMTVFCVDHLTSQAFDIVTDYCNPRRSEYQPLQGGKTRQTSGRRQVHRQTSSQERPHHELGRHRQARWSRGQPPRNCEQRSVTPSYLLTIASSVDGWLNIGCTASAGCRFWRG